jgi:EAL domain-containing protein (putative c-di-GMP-specific phosphodiesterase class I)
VARLHEPIRLNTRDVFISCSIGITLSATECEQAEMLLRDADTAMYQAKLNGKSGFVVFDRSMNDRLVDRLEIEIGLRQAIEQDEFRVLYQPIVNLETGVISGAEALVRWQHPKLGLLSPSKFIPIAEETGLIVPIGTWVLREACSQARAWQDQFPERSSFVISVNLSARQLQQADLTQTVHNILKETGLPPASLKLEITESLIMENIESTVSRLNELKGLGVLLAMDDFGTGYSSLSYLQRLPVDTVKIDRSFVNVMDSESEPSAIVQAIVTLCRVMKLSVTGEGIETTAQLAQLQSLGCDLGQGYLFAKPVTVGDFDIMLSAVDQYKSPISRALSGTTTPVPNTIHMAA